MGHIIKAFLNFRITTESLGANVTLRGPIQGTIRSETENGINLRNILFYFILLAKFLFGVSDVRLTSVKEL